MCHPFDVCHTYESLSIRSRVNASKYTAVLLLKTEESHGGLPGRVTGAGSSSRCHLLNVMLIPRATSPVKQTSVQSLSGVCMSLLTFWKINFLICIEDLNISPDRQILICLVNGFVVKLNLV